MKSRADKNPDIFQDPNSGLDFSVLHIAAQFGRVSILKWYKNVLKFSPDINPLDKSNTATPLMIAVQVGSKNVINYYISVEKEEVWNRKANGSRRASKGISLLHVAAGVGQNEITKILLSKGGLFSLISISNLLREPLLLLEGRVELLLFYEILLYKTLIIHPKIT